MMLNSLKQFVISFSFITKIFSYYYKYKCALDDHIKCLVISVLPPKFTQKENAFLDQAFVDRDQVIYSLYRSEYYYCKMENVLLLGNSGLVIKGNNILTESSFDDIRLKKSPFIKKPSLLKTIKLNKPCTSIFHIPWGERNLYHWFIDCLPRLYFIKEYSSELVLVSNYSLPTYQKETLELMIKDFSNIKLEFIKSSQVIKAKEYLLTNFPANHNSGYLPFEILSFIREKIIDGYGIRNEFRNRRIFVSRKKASLRRIINENEMYSFLLKNGFEIICSEDLPFREQVSIFNSSSLIVSTHGAGLTNIIFAENAEVVEIHSNDRIRTHYFMLCKSLGHNYTPIFGQESDENKDFLLDVESFMITIKKIIKTKNEV